MDVTCAGCGKTINELEVFPGKICVECFAVTPEGSRMPTADEVVKLWGGK